MIEVYLLTSHALPIRLASFEEQSDAVKWAEMQAKEKYNASSQLAVFGYNSSNRLLIACYTGSI